MEHKLQVLLDKLSTDGADSMDDEEFTHAEQIKYAMSVLLDYPHYIREQHAQLVMAQFSISKATALKRLAEALELFPSLEKVSKAFERARVSRMCYQFIMLCVDKKNTRDAALYLKLIKEMWGLDNPEDIEAGTNQVTIVNLLKSAPESLGIKLPDNFDINKFIDTIEGEYERKRKSDTAE